MAFVHMNGNSPRPQGFRVHLDQDMVATPLTGLLKKNPCFVALIRENVLQKTFQRRFDGKGRIPQKFKNRRGPVRLSRADH